MSEVWSITLDSIYGVEIEAHEGALSTSYRMG